MLRVGAGDGADITCAPGAVAPLIGLLAAAEPTGAGHPVLAVTATGRESEDLAGALRCFLPAESVLEFPSWETLPHERLCPRSDTVGRRLAVLRRLAHPSPTSRRPARSPWSSRRCAPCCSRWSRAWATWNRSRCRPATRCRFDEIVDGWSPRAYTRVDLVERRGEFAVRGGILDVFPPTEEHPLRVEFCGDTVEEIRWFAVADQRSPARSRQHGLWAPPCRELLLTDEVRQRARRSRRATTRSWPSCSTRSPTASPVEGMEALAPVLVDGLVLLLDVLPAGTPRRGLRPGAGPHPGPRPGRHQPGVPRGLVGGRCRWRHGAPIDLRRRGVPDARRRPRTRSASSACRGGR